MATNAYGRDFWVSQVFHSKDKREGYRHVQVHDLANGRAKCFGYSVPLKKCIGKATRISLKNLATRWELCTEQRPCGFCARGTANVTERDAETQKVG